MSKERDRIVQAGAALAMAEEANSQRELEFICKAFAVGVFAALHHPEWMQAAIAQVPQEVQEAWQFYADLAVSAAPFDGVES